MGLLDSPYRWFLILETSGEQSVKVALLQLNLTLVTCYHEHSQVILCWSFQRTFRHYCLVFTERIINLIHSLYFFALNVYANEFISDYLQWYRTHSDIIFCAPNFVSETKIKEKNFLFNLKNTYHILRIKHNIENTIWIRLSICALKH